MIQVDHIYPIFGNPLSDQLLRLDLSQNNEEEAFAKVNSIDSLQDYINTQLSIQNKSIGIGGYREKRNLYQRFKHFNNEAQPRCYHLGIDIWTQAGTEIYAPIDGEVHSQSIIDLDGDYGGCLILKHQIEDISFYTLYGHLSHDSIHQFKNGDAIKGGTIIAKLGDVLENGGWPPHLHFQVIKNIGEYFGDYPGVCDEGYKSHFFENCPDPSFLLI